MYYVYALVDVYLGFERVFYIGKGKGLRHNVHLYESKKRTENRKKYAHIKWLKNNNHEIRIKKLFENIKDEQLAYDIEEQIIRFFGRKDIDVGGVLLNICLDNRPPSNLGKPGKKWTEEQKAKRRGSGNPMYGKAKNETWRKSMEKFKGSGNPMYGKTHSDNLKEKWKGIARGGCKNYTDEIRNRISKSVSGVNNPKSKKWLIKTPAGEIIEQVGLWNFCKARGLYAGQLIRCANKRKIDPSYNWKGWECDEKYE